MPQGGSLHGLFSSPSFSQSTVGSDVAELLMQDRSQQERYKRQEPALGPVSLVDEEWRQLGTLDLITGEVPPVVETQAQIVEKFTKLLYYGRKKVSVVWEIVLIIFCVGFIGVLKGKGGLEVPCGCGIHPSSCICTTFITVEGRKLKRP